MAVIVSVTLTEEWSGRKTPQVWAEYYDAHINNQGGGGVFNLVLKLALNIWDWDTNSNRFPINERVIAIVYQRVQPPPLSISDFVRTKDTTDNDLMKVVLEDGGVLFFAFKKTPNAVSDPKWRLDKQLLPENLTALLREHNLESQSDFVLSGYNATVGRLLRLDIEPSTHWRTTMWFMSESAVKSIRPARRPRRPSVPILGGDMQFEQSSDYH